MLSLVGIQNFAISYIAIWSVSPPLFSSGVGRLMVVLAVAIWVYLEFLRRDGLARGVTLPVTLAFIFMFYTSSFDFFFYGAEALLREIQIYIMLFFLIVWQSRRNNMQSLVPVFWSVLAVYPVWLWTTVQTVTTVNSHAARVLVRSSDEALELAQQGVGGYSLVYGSLVLLPALIGLFRNRVALRGKALPRVLRAMPGAALALVATNIFLCIALVLTAGFSIAVIALVAVLLSSVLLGTLSLGRLLITVVATLAFALYARPILEVSLIAILPMAEGTNFAIKIRDILASLAVGDAVGSAEGRIERYVRSLVLFADHPILGVLRVDHVGKHSEILDNFARWGVFVGSIFVFLLVVPATWAMRHSKRHFGVGLSTLAGVLVIFGMNNGFAAAGLMLYIMFPVSIYMLNNYEARRSAGYLVTPVA